MCSGECSGACNEAADTEHILRSSLLFFTSFLHFFSLLDKTAPTSRGRPHNPPPLRSVSPAYCSLWFRAVQAALDLTERLISLNTVWLETGRELIPSHVSVRVLQTILRLAHEHFHPLMPTRLHKNHQQLMFTASHPAGLKRRWGNVPTWTDMSDCPECRMSHVWCVTLYMCHPQLQLVSHQD